MKKSLSLALYVLFYIFLYSGSSHQALPAPPPPPSQRLLKAYQALQAWKHAMTSDPNNFTSNWHGSDVCKYNGVTCYKAPDDPHVQTVAGIDLNHAGISGSLPEALGLLTDLAFFHINSNRFSGTIPRSFRNLRLLYELDASNNQFTGSFPQVVLYLPALKFLDIRFNGFQGDVPSKLFDLKLDAIFINDNKFRIRLPYNIGNSPVSALVMANNNIEGPLPLSIARMENTLEEIILSNTGLTGCLPQEIGKLVNLTVLDVSSNNLVGSLPESLGRMRSLEQLDVENNRFSGKIPASICSLPKVDEITLSNNYFSGKPQICSKLPDKDDRKNCIPNRPSQRSATECKSLRSQRVGCNV
ncbi:Leucine-rich repeat extensin-like protein 6 [Ranunculus cassubicifolius]